MTGIVFDIKEFALHDGPGIRTTVFLKGCPAAVQLVPQSRGPFAAAANHGECGCLRALRRVQGRV